ncbi:MAG: tyrosine-type recombinase/integrase [Methylocystis sp.]
MVAKRDFTDRFLKSIKPTPAGKRVIHWDAVVPQFGIRVGDKSSRENVGTFVLVARFPGNPNPAPRRVGDYPIMTLARAREIARAWREDIARGIDPKVKEEERRQEEERCRKEQARAQADTFAMRFAKFEKDHLAELRTGAAVKRAVEKHVFPVWGDRPIREIRRADVNELVRDMKKDSPIQANRVLTYLKQFFGWCVDQELLEDSPAASVKRPAKEVKRDRVLTDAEIHALWLACSDLGAFGRAFRFLLVTGARLSEVGGLQWREVDSDARRWTIPRERAKADRAHEVPLSDLALSILEECPRIGPHPFTTRGDVAIAGWSKSKAALDVAMLAQLQMEAEAKGDTSPVSLPPWRLHDLRRTCATNLARVGVDRIVISKLLNHAEGGVTSVYDRHARDPEKRAAMDRWGARLQEIVEGRDSGNVVPLAAVRA